MDAPTDETLLQEFLDGKTASYELLVRRHSQELFQFIMRFTGDSVATDDVIQETFVQLHRSADRFEAGRRFKPWLFTIAANKARDHLRRLGRRREVPFDAQIGRDKEDGQRFVDLLAADNVVPDEEMGWDEKRRAVRNVVAGLPEKYGEVLILAYYHRFPYREIAEIVGIPLGTVKSRLHAAILEFGRQYKEAVAEEEAKREQSG